jgi:CRP/FNR family cyclic AMP-dependent transcriptional regulator
MDERIRLLQNTPIFGGVVDEVLALLLDRVAEVVVRKGEFFCREGDDGVSAFVLERGSVSILKTWEGRSYLLRHLHAGDCFGEVALMDFCRRSASVLADEDCVAIELSTSDLRQVASQNLEQFTMIYMNMGRELCRRLRDADERLFRAKIEVGLSTGEYAFPSA